MTQHIHRAPGGAPDIGSLFVRRPVLAIVLNLLLVVAGIAAFTGIEVRELPGGDHAVMHCEGSTAERRRRYDYLYGRWLPERGRVPVDSPPIEEYVPPGGDLGRLDEVTKVHVRLAPGRAA